MYLFYSKFIEVIFIIASDVSWFIVYYVCFVFCVFCIRKFGCYRRNGRKCLVKKKVVVFVEIWIIYLKISVF